MVHYDCVSWPAGTTAHELAVVMDDHEYTAGKSNENVVATWPNEAYGKAGDSAVHEQVQGSGDITTIERQLCTASESNEELVATWLNEAYGKAGDSEQVQGSGDITTIERQLCTASESNKALVATWPNEAYGKAGDRAVHEQVQGSGDITTTERQLLEEGHVYNNESLVAQPNMAYSMAGQLIHSGMSAGKQVVSVLLSLL